MPSEQPREGTQVERCVTCGSPVEVVTSDEGTSCYRPAQPQPRGEGDDLAARLDARAEMWERKGGLGASIAAGAYRQAAEMARASTHPEQSARVRRAIDRIQRLYTRESSSAVYDLIDALEPASTPSPEQGEGGAG